MKKIYVLTAIASMLFAVSCNKTEQNVADKTANEEISDANETSGGKLKSFNVQDFATKITGTDNGSISVNWEGDETITVYNKTNDAYTNFSNSSSDKVTFECSDGLEVSEGDELCFFYPAVNSFTETESSGKAAKFNHSSYIVSDIDDLFDRVHFFGKTTYEGTVPSVTMNMVGTILRFNLLFDYNFNYSFNIIRDLTISIPVSELVTLDGESYADPDYVSDDYTLGNSISWGSITQGEEIIAYVYVPSQTISNALELTVTDITFVDYPEHTNVWTGKTKSTDIELQSGKVQTVNLSMEPSSNFITITCSKDNATIVLLSSFQGEAIEYEIELKEGTNKVFGRPLGFRTSSGGAITSFDLSNWDGSNVTNASKMFYSSGIASAPDLSTISNATNASYMFYGCRSLTTPPDLSALVNLTNAEDMFQYCTSLETPSDLSALVNLTNVRGMFYSCTSLTTSPDLSALVNLTDVSYMFVECSSIESLDLANIDFSTVDYTMMLYKTTSLKEVTTSVSDETHLANLKAHLEETHSDKTVTQGETSSDGVTVFTIE